MDDQHQNDADGEQVRGLPVKGYKPTQSDEAIAVVNRFKELEERVLREIDNLQGDRYGNVDFCDQRLLAVGKTQLQGAFMFLARSIFQPQRFALPEDEQRDFFGQPNHGHEAD